jgi:hypothetical protein
MNKFLTFSFCVALAAAVSVPAAPASPDLIARIHFAGASQVSADTNAAAFTKFWCSPEALALRNQTLNKLSRAPYAWFKAKLAPGTGDGAAQLRPLLDDLLTAEWFLQVRDGSNGSPEYALAIRLDAARAQLWQANLQSVIEAWTGMSVQKSPNGWSLKKHLPPNQIRFVRTGDWVVFGLGQDGLPVNDELVRHVTVEKRPAAVEKNIWLSADVNWPRLARWFPAINPFDLPETQLQMAGHDHVLRLDGKLVFPRPLGLTLEKWRIPAETIHEPLISFTALRGLAPWLEKQGWVKPYDISPVPNQMFVWAMDLVPIQTFAAIPVPDGKAALKELEQKMSANPGWQSHLTLPLTMAMTNNNQLSWSGLPFVSPKLSALHGSAGDFLFAEFFPNNPKSKPLPPDLFTQLKQPDLVYYDWEITGERLKMLPQLTQLALMITRHQQLDAPSAANKWLAVIGPTLGNTVTEVTQTAPDELSFKRSAPGGLTAIELTALASWLEATNFPGCDLRMPLPVRRHPHPQTNGASSVKIPAAPPPAAAH